MLRSKFSRKRRIKRRLRQLQASYVHRIIDHAGIDVVLDVGANIGQTYDALRENGFTGKVISFEPIPDIHAGLVERAKSDPKWIVAPRCAVGSADGEVLLNVYPASYMSSVLPLTSDMLDAHPRLREVEKVPTPSVRLDDIYDEYCSRDDKVFLKIDTQGFERMVLDGAVETLKRVRGVHIELSLIALYDGEETYLSFFNEFHAAGFEPHLVIENGFEKAWCRQRQLDAVFMRPAPSPSPSR